MSKSVRTEPERIIAEHNLLRHSDGEIRLPRISQRKPAVGDIHPLEKATIRNILRVIPPEYLYGLKGIELRAREGKPGKLKWGSTLGLYLPDEKIIWLYSFPTQGSIEGASLQEVRNEFGYSINICKVGDHVEFNFVNIIGLRHRFARTLLHELGHHFVEQYHCKNRRIKSWADEELIASMHMSRISKVDLSPFIGAVQEGKTVTADAEQYGSIVNRLIGKPCERTLAANSIKIRFGTDKDPRGIQYLWIDPPWRFEFRGQCITASFNYDDDSFSQWSQLFSPLNRTVFRSWEIKQDGTTVFSFDRGYKLVLPLNETSIEEDDWYHHWYARDKENKSELQHPSRLKSTRL